MNIATGRAGILILCALATACGGLNHKAMTPKAERSPAPRIDKSIKVGAVTGGGKIANVRITLIAVGDEDFAKAEKAALESSGVFKAVVQSAPDIELRTTILSQTDYRDGGGDLSLSVRYDFYDARTNALVYSDAFLSSTQIKWASTALETVARNNLDALIYSLPHRWPGSPAKETFRDRVGPPAAGIFEGQPVGLFVWHGSGLVAVSTIGADYKRSLLTGEMFDAFAKQFVQQSQTDLRIPVAELAKEHIVLTTEGKERKVDTLASAKQQGLDRIFEAIVTPSLTEQGAPIGLLPTVTATIRVN